MPAIAIDLGGTRLRAALVAEGRVMERRSLDTEPAGGAEAWMQAMVSLAQPWRDRARVVGVAVTGVLRQGRWHALNPDVLPVPEGFPILAELERRLATRIVAVNDGQAAAWGEFRRGAGQGSSSLAFMTVSTGIGGGLVLGGRLVEGSRGGAGSIGHTLADPAGPRCGCGRLGCLEAVASGSALALQARAQHQLGPVRAGEPWADALLDRSAQAVAATLSNLQAAFDPDVVVLGGGLGLSDGYMDRVERALAAAPSSFRPSLMAAALGDNAGLIGAAELALAR